MEREILFGVFLVEMQLPLTVHAQVYAFRPVQETMLLRPKEKDVLESIVQHSLFK